MLLSVGVGLSRVHSPATEFQRLQEVVLHITAPTQSNEIRILCKNPHPT